MKHSIKTTNLTVKRFVEDMKISRTPEAFIADRDTLAIAVSSDPMSYYFAIEEDSYLFIDILAIPIGKGSHLRKHFNSV